MILLGDNRKSQWENRIVCVCVWLILMKRKENDIEIKNRQNTKLD